MDSLPDPGILLNYKESEILTYPRDKDYTDTELAVATLRERGCGRVGILGGGGGRLDHLLGIYALFQREQAPDFWITAREEVFLVKGEFRLEGWKGREVSFFPVGERPAAMTSRGLKWPLDSLTWKAGDFGISNVVLADTAEVRMKTGRLILVKALGERRL